jgi:hypothetical protein
MDISGRAGRGATRNVAALKKQGRSSDGGCASSTYLFRAGTAGCAPRGGDDAWIFRHGSRIETGERNSQYQTPLRCTHGNDDDKRSAASEQ